MNVDRLFSTSSPKHWRCAIQGFSYVTHFDANVYRLLRQKGHFHRALKEDFGGTHVREKLLQFVAVAYLNGVEELQDPEGVFHTMLDNWAPKDLADLVWFFWTLRDEEDARLREKVLEFWKHCYTRIQGHEQENARMLSKLNLLASFFSTITLEQKEWWLQAAPYADEDYNASFRVEALDRLATTNPAEVAEVFLRMLNRCLPTFDPKDIRSCVEKLYAKAQKEAADRICNEYERRGARDLLRDIYEKQRRST